MEGAERVTPLTATQLAALVERVPDIIWRYRLVPTPGFEYVSRSVFALTGYTPAEHYADPALGLKIVHPDDAQRLRTAMDAPEEHKSLMVRWRHKSGFELMTEQRMVAIRDEAGQLVALEGVGRPVVNGERKLQVPTGDLVLDLATHRVLIEDRVVELTPAEHRILALLASRTGPVSASNLTSALWGTEDQDGQRVVQVHVSNLRKKIEADPTKPRRLVTHRGLGYELVK